MRATLIGLTALVVIGLGAQLAQAGPYPIYPRQAPDACGPGYYVTHPCGMVYGPNYWLTPGFSPYNGPAGCPGSGAGMQQSVNFPTHPYARGPRDFFMVYDNWYDIPAPWTFGIPRP